MRVLLTAGSGFGHVQPLLPLARAFRDAGCEVALATAEAWRDAVERDGIAFRSAGLGPREVDAAFAPVAARARELPPAARRAFVFPARFAEIEAPARIEDLRRAADALRPDLIVHESADLAGPLVAAERGLRSANHAFGLPVPLACTLAAGEAMAPHWSAAGLEPEPHAGAFRGPLVAPWPAGLGGEAPPARAPVLPIRIEPGVAHAEVVERTRPLVYVTLGTVLNDPAVFRTLLAGLAEVDCDVLATVGRDVDPATLGTLPCRVRVERFVPQAEVLPSVTAVVCHAGSGTTLGALAHGLPLLLCPQGADQFDNADACARAGVARVLPPPELTVERVAAELGALLHDGAVAARAREIAAEIAAMPDPAAVAARLLAGAA